MEKFNPQKSKDNLNKAIKKRLDVKDNKKDDKKEEKSALDIMQDARILENKKDPLAGKSRQEIRLQGQNSREEKESDFFEQEGIKDWQNEVGNSDDEIQGGAMEHLIKSQSEKQSEENPKGKKDKVKEENEEVKDSAEIDQEVEELIPEEEVTKKDFSGEGKAQDNLNKKEVAINNLIESGSVREMSEDEKTDDFIDLKKGQEGSYGEEEKIEAGFFRLEADKFQEGLVKAIKENKKYKKALIVSRKSLNKFDKVKNVLGIKGKEGTAKKEYADKREKYDNMKKDIEKLEEKVRKSYGKYLSKLHEEKGGFEVFDDVVDIKIVDEKTGEKKDVKINMVDFYNRKLEDVEKAKNEVLNEKDRKFYMEWLDNYRKWPKSKRIAFSVLVAGGVGVGIGLGAGGLGGALLYGSYRAGKGLAKATVSSFATAGVDKVTKKINKKGSVKDKDTMEKAIKEGFSEKNEDILKNILDFNKKQKRRNIDRAVIVGLSGAGLSYSIMSFDSVDKNFSSIGSEVDNKANVPDEPVNPIKITDIEEKPIEMNPGLEDFKMVEQLGKGDTVWGKLMESDHFDGDEKGVANTLNKFRAEVREGLVTNQGMTPDQANEYIKWKFHHMQPGDEIFIDKDSDFKIKGFDDDTLVDKFKSSELIGDVEKAVSQVEPSASALEVEINDPLNGIVAKEYAEKMTEPYEQERRDGINTGIKEVDGVEVAREAEMLNSLKEDFDSLNIGGNSDVMRAAEEMTVEDLKKALPSGETRISWGSQERSMINNFSEESLEILNNNTAVEGNLPGIGDIRDSAEISYEDYKKLQGIANIVAEGRFDDSMTVADVIRQLK